MWTNTVVYACFFGNVQDVVLHFRVGEWRFEDGTVIKELHNSCQSTRDKLSLSIPGDIFDFSMSTRAFLIIASRTLLQIG